MKSSPLKLDSVLRELLAARGISARELARQTGIAQSTIASMLSPKKAHAAHRPENLRTLARFFGCSLEYLLWKEQAEPVSLEQLMTEQIFDGFLKVRIERAFPMPDKKVKK